MERPFCYIELHIVIDMALTVNKRYSNYFNGYLSVAGLLMIIAGCAVNPVTGQNNFVMMSEDDEIKLGRQAHPDIIKQYGGIYDNAALQSYMQHIGESLAAVSHRSNLNYRFTILDSSMVNAFALPGGYIYITRGLLAYLNSEAELAAVLGHEIGHVTARHSVRQISASRAAEFGFTIGSIFVPELQTQAAQSIFNTLGGALISGYGREHELEADRLGAEYLARDGYDPQAMIRVIEVLKNQEDFEKQLAKEEGREPRIYHGVFASHPDNDTRLQQVVASADELRSTSANRDDREGFLDQIEGLVFGDSESNGVVRGNAFYHSEFGIAFEFPAGWKINNLPDRLTAQPKNDDAMIQVIVKNLDRPYTPREFMTIELKLDDLKDEEELRPAGLEGYTAVSQLTTSFGKRDARISVIFFNGHAFVFMAAAKDKKMPEKYERDFLAAAESFHTLDSKELSLAKAPSIHLYHVQQKDNVDKISSRSTLPNHAVEQLRLLNGIYPHGEPVAGQRFKIVQ